MAAAPSKLSDEPHTVIDEYARAEQQKLSGIAHKQTLLRLYLIPTIHRRVTR